MTTGSEKPAMVSAAVIASSTSLSAGTTRDTVREEILLEGIPLHIIDTAGLRDTADEVERLGIARAWAAIEKADLALLLIDAR
ncbi:MAG: GTPase, partial [Alphaproteobacteria bacterium]